MSKKKKPKFPHGTPKTVCRRCEGVGRIKDQYITRLFGSGNWAMTKCTTCDGSGKMERLCIECKELLYIAQLNDACVNAVCTRYGLATLVSKDA
jgi:DnaJ-class molecular chaperone